MNLAKCNKAHLCLTVVLYFTVFIVAFTEVLEQGEIELRKSNYCVNKTTCGDCIKTADCFWCSQPHYEDGDRKPVPRCDVNVNMGNVSQCQQEFIFQHKNEIDIVEFGEIEKAVGKRAATSISPQRMKIKLRVGESVKFDVNIGEMQDYPLDLYFLMDLTKSMENDKEVLAKEGAVLATKMKNITSKFRMGFGSFIDKVALPFVQTSPLYPEHLKTHCPTCVLPYSFRNHLTLSENVASFSEEVKNANVSATNDLPEGGFDALMQVMTCDQQIGWAEQARKLVIFATDGAFHIAGDGKLGGIIRPNDGLCHLDEKGYYTHSSILDYPSIAQLSSKAIEKSITVIFSVTSDQSEIYQQLSTRLESSQTIVITADSSNIVDTVEAEYKNISQIIEISDNFTREYISVTYSSKCLDLNSEEKTTKCKNIMVGYIVTFTVQVKLIKCPGNLNDWKQIFRIYRSTIPDSLLIELEMLCSCPCEKPGAETVNSPKCGGKGNLRCGICECNSNHFGRNCECNYLDKNGTRLDKDISCKKSDSEEICSGRGSCICGQCNCTPRKDRNEEYSGTFCECDNFSCERISGELCSGHGSCVCGKCDCYNGWNGTGCACSTDINTCVDSDTGDICGGQNQGECRCGKCFCKNPYSGEFCEKCKQSDSCPDKCADLKDCVQCKLFSTGAYENAADCDLHCWKHKGLKRDEFVTVLKESDDPDTDEVKCKEKDAVDNCAFYFLYNYNRKVKEYTIQAVREKECPPELPVFWIVFGIISLIVVVGILTVMMWQLYEYIQMKRDYAKFKTDAQNVNWQIDENVLYREPKSTFNNPLYGGMEEQIGFPASKKE